LGLLIRGVGVAFICRARAKVLAAAARPSACREVPAAVVTDPIPATVFRTRSKPPGVLDRHPFMPATDWVKCFFRHEQLSTMPGIRGGARILRDLGDKIETFRGG